MPVQTSKVCRHCGAHIGRRHTDGLWGMIGYAPDGALGCPENPRGHEPRPESLRRDVATLRYALGLNLADLSREITEADRHAPDPGRKDELTGEYRATARFAGRLDEILGKFPEEDPS